MTEERTIPAMNYEVFGLVCPTLRVVDYTSRGHYPSVVEISDMNLSVYIDEMRASVAYPLKNQRHQRGSNPTKRARVSLSVKIPGGKVYYANVQDASRFNLLYEDSKKAAIATVDSLHETVKTYAESFLQGRLAKGDAFRIKAIETINMATDQTCYWEAGVYNVAVPGSKELEKETRLALKEVDGNSTDDLPWPLILDAAGELFTDQCRLGFVRKSMCSIAAAAINNSK